MSQSWCEGAYICFWFSPPGPTAPKAGSQSATKLNRNCFPPILIVRWAGLVLNLNQLCNEKELSLVPFSTTSWMTMRLTLDNEINVHYGSLLSPNLRGGKFNNLSTNLLGIFLLNSQNYFKKWHWCFDRIRPPYATKKTMHPICVPQEVQNYIL